jgi:glycosyltransferase involved in cell wall biosynthesis
VQGSITVAIPTFNRPDSVERLISDVAPQLNHDDELLIIDDGWVNIDPSVITRCGINNIRYIRHEKNIGMVPTWNDCLSLAEKEWICIVHDDDTIFSGALNIIRRAISVADGPAVIGNDTDNGLTLDNGFRFQYSEPGSWAVLNSPRTPSGVTVHRSIVEERGFFDDRFIYSSDLEYFPRLCVKFPLLNVQAPSIVKYNLHDSNHQYKTWEKADFFAQLRLLEDTVLSYSTLSERQAAKIRNERWRALTVYVFRWALRTRNRRIMKAAGREFIKTTGLYRKLRLRAWVAASFGL